MGLGGAILSAIRKFCNDLRTDIEHAGLLRLLLALLFVGIGGWLIQNGLTAGGAVSLGFGFFLLSNAVSG